MAKIICTLCGRLADTDPCRLCVEEKKTSTEPDHFKSFHKLRSYIISKRAAEGKWIPEDSKPLITQISPNATPTLSKPPPLTEKTHSSPIPESPTFPKPSFPSPSPETITPSSMPSSILNSIPPPPPLESKEVDIASQKDLLDELDISISEEGSWADEISQIEDLIPPSTLSSPPKEEPDSYKAFDEVSFPDESHIQSTIADYSGLIQEPSEEKTIPSFDEEFPPPPPIPKDEAPSELDDPKKLNALLTELVEQIQDITPIQSNDTESSLKVKPDSIEESVPVIKPPISSSISIESSPSEIPTQESKDLDLDELDKALADMSSRLSSASASVVQEFDRAFATISPSEHKAKPMEKPSSKIETEEVKSPTEVSVVSELDSRIRSRTVPVLEEDNIERNLFHITRKVEYKKDRWVVEITVDNLSSEKIQGLSVMDKIDRKIAIYKTDPKTKEILQDEHESTIIWNKRKIKSVGSIILTYETNLDPGNRGVTIQWGKFKEKNGILMAPHD
ncbi:MAG: hypothetical protein ACFFDT_31775 [Candidatus Hodarchaeota archaeon]